jgi:1-acylglycerone phosphate reductase
MKRAYNYLVEGGLILLSIMRGNVFHIITPIVSCMLTIFIQLLSVPRLKSICPKQKICLEETFFPQTFFPQILLAKRTIVNVGSVAGHMPLPFYSVFSATKAALYAYSECMRVELAPFGIKVVYIQAGNVKTDGMRLRGRTALNENSLFKPIEDGFLERQEIAATTGMDPDGFAKQLVQKVLTGTGKVIWIGESAFWCRAMNTLENFLPFSLWPFFFSQGYHMERLKT